MSPTLLSQDQQQRLVQQRLFQLSLVNADVFNVNL